MTSKSSTSRGVLRSMVPSLAVLVTLVIALIVAAALSGSKPDRGNVNAQVFAGADINNVVILAMQRAVSLGPPAVLTRSDLTAAISEDRASATGRLAQLTLRSMAGGRATFSLDTPWQKKVCAWVPVSFWGQVYAWPVHFCKP
jgi:hypothetical protein